MCTELRNFMVDDVVWLWLGALVVSEGNVGEGMVGGGVGADPIA